MDNFTNKDFQEMVASVMKSAIKATVEYTCLKNKKPHGLQQCKSLIESKIAEEFLEPKHGKDLSVLDDPSAFLCELIEWVEEETKQELKSLPEFNKLFEEKIFVLEAGEA